MPVPATIADLDTDESLNSPNDSETITPSTRPSDYIRAHAAIIKTLSNDSMATATLAASGGSALVGFLQSGTGAVARTGQAKMRDVVSVFDFMTTAQIADVQARTASLDVTSAIKAAADSVGTGGTVICPPGKYRIQNALNITNRANIKGFGRLTTFLLTDATSKFTIKGSEVSKLENNVVSDIEFEGNSTVVSGGTPQSAALIELDWCKYLKFVNCFFYHVNIDTNHMAWWSIESCEFFDLNINSYYTQASGEPNDISGGPKVTDSYFSNAPIYLEDTVDYQAINSHFFNGDWALKIRVNNWTPDVGTVAGIPFFLSNCIFDSTSGHALDIYNGFGAQISNCWISAGRGYGVAGASLYQCNRVTVSGCTFHYCGNTTAGTPGLVIEQCDAVSVVGGTYSNNYGYGIKLNSSDRVSIVGANFTNLPSVFGGGYTQADGVIDTGGLSTNVTVIGCHFDSTFTNKIYAPDASNTLINNTNYSENIVSGTLLRAQSDNSMALGSQTYRFSEVHCMWMRNATYAVASLPAAGTAGEGARCFVSDANATTFASIVAGGGANKVPVYSDGTNWRIG